MPEFLEQFLGKPERRQLEKNAIRTDYYDRQDAKEVFHDIPDLQVADDRLCGITDTGHHALEDVFFSAAKANPQQRHPQEMRPEYLVNKEVNRQAMGLKEFEELRQFTAGDLIGSALAAIAIEPDLETIFDKLKEEQKLAKKMQEKADQLQGLRDQQRDLDEMFEEWQNSGGDPDDPNAPEPQNYQEASENIARSMAALEEEYENDSQQLNEQLRLKRGQITQDLKAAIQKGIEQGETLEAASMLWGTERGQLHHLPPEERIKFAQRINTPKFKRLAQLIGPLTRLAMAEQARKTDYGREEIFDVTLGNDLSRVVPSELVDLRHPVRKKLFWKRYTERTLMQYQLRGAEKVAKGGIIFCEDGSGSMMGDKEIWAKAVGLALYQIARKQKRSFYGIHFGGPRELKCFDFRDPRAIDPDKVLEFASISFGGGTDFVTPLSKSLDILREEFVAKGAIKGDIVFVTDGICGVPPQWLKDFKAEQQRLGFRVFGINIGGHHDDQPLSDICDKRVSTIQDLITGNEVREIFRAV
jgi:uncharacterized protein with von Willebrand factor type A (vWA) domain